MNNWKFYFVTFGCKVNQQETETFKEAWQKQGGMETDTPQEADFICINSCAITGRAERDARNAINKLRKSAPNARIILTGCAAQFFESFMPRKNANYEKPDLCVYQNRKHILFSDPNALFSPCAETPRSCDNNIISNFARARAIIKVQDGCTQNCTYCIVPQTRSHPHSESPERILRACQALAENGHSELMISGINLRQYGKDKPEYGSFWDMLAWLDKELTQKYQDRLRLRISSVEPSQLNEKALRTISEAKLLCPHLHLSLQHASPKILREMGRGHYKARDILKFANSLSQHWPIFALGADILIGFPGETGEDLQILLDFIEESPLTHAHVFPYSQRQGTIAGKRCDQVLQRIRHERANRVREKINAKKMAFWEKNLTLPFMHITPEKSENNTKGLIRGINEFYVPCYLKKSDSTHKILKVKPVQICEDGIIVETII